LDTSNIFIFICGATPRICETARYELAKSDGRPSLDLAGQLTCDKAQLKKSGQFVEKLSDSLRL
jgi:hypothetical protein